MAGLVIRMMRYRELQRDAQRNLGLLGGIFGWLGESNAVPISITQLTDFAEYPLLYFPKNDSLVLEG